MKRIFVLAISIIALIMCFSVVASAEENAGSEHSHTFVDYKCTECGEWDYTPEEYFEFTFLNGAWQISCKINIRVNR